MQQALKPVLPAAHPFAILDAMADAVLVVDAAHAIVFANAAACRLFAAEKPALCGMALAALVPQAAADCRTWNASTVGHSFEAAAIARDGRSFPARLTVAHFGDAHAHRYVVSVRDRSDAHELERQIVARSLRDPLTGLATRTLFLDRIDGALARRRDQTNKRALAVLCLGIDRFKAINDSLGYAAGDELLGQVSARLSAELGANAAIARLGGDEFGLLIDDAAREADIAVVAERALGVFGGTFALASRNLPVVASIGLAFAGADSHDTPASLLSNADIAMLRAKSTGGNRIEIFEASRHGEAFGLLELELALRDALAAGEFDVVYQPIVALDGGAMRGVEALLRWTRNGVAVSPAVFIPIAEETGLIVEIGAWVLRRACTQMATWRRTFGTAAPDYVSVNLSARQLDRDDVPALVRRVLAETGLAARHLELELTESTVVQNADAGREVLRAVVGQGVALSIDDFGTGQSSLSQLPRLPISKIKIDRAFVGRMDSESESFEIVRIIVSLANALGMLTVAEGIEREAQAHLLRQLGCRYGQGYLYDRPLDVAAVNALCVKAAGLPLSDDIAAAMLRELRAATS